jgi:hypothetical protein
MRRYWVILLAVAMALVIALPAGAGKPQIDCDKHPNHPECVADPGDDTPIAGTTCVDGGSAYDVKTDDFSVVLNGKSDTACIDVIANPGAWKVEIETEGIVRGMSLFLRDSVGPGDGCFEGGSCGYVFRRPFPSEVDFLYIDGSYVNVCGTNFGESVWNSFTGVFDYYSDVDETVESPVSFIPSMSGRDGSVVTLHVDLPPISSDESS